MNSVSGGQWQTPLQPWVAVYKQEWQDSRVGSQESLYTRAALQQVSL